MRLVVSSSLEAENPLQDICCQCEGEGGVFAVPDGGTSREEGVGRMSVVGRIWLFLGVGGERDPDGHRMG